MLSLTNHSHASSLMSLAIHRWFRRISLFIFELLKNEVIFAHQNLISNWSTYPKSTGELISFIFSDRSVRSLVSAKRSANHWWFHFLADLWSQSEFRTQRKTDPKSEMTRCGSWLDRVYSGGSHQSCTGQNKMEIVGVALLPSGIRIN